MGRVLGEWGKSGNSSIISPYSPRGTSGLPHPETKKNAEVNNKPPHIGNIRDVFIVVPSTLYAPTDTWPPIKRLTALTIAITEASITSIEMPWPR